MEGSEDPVYLVNGDGTTADSQSDDDDESSQDEDEERGGEDYILLPQDPSDDEALGETRTLNGEGEPTFEEHDITTTTTTTRESSSTIHDPPESVTQSVQVQESHEIENELPNPRESSTELLGAVEGTQSDSTAGDMILNTSDSWQQGSSAASSTDRNYQMQDDVADKIRQAMAGFVLPSSSTPLWAQAVPEDVWKAELLQRLRETKTKK